ncbi:MAG: hypothetical protein ACKN81_02270, partial [Pirellulaceae bacterium]
MKNHRRLVGAQTDSKMDGDTADLRQPIESPFGAYLMLTRSLLLVAAFFGLRNIASGSEPFEAFLEKHC